MLTEQLAHELREASKGQVTAHLLVPGFTLDADELPDQESLNGQQAERAVDT